MVPLLRLRWRHRSRRCLSFGAISSSQLHHFKFKYRLLFPSRTIRELDGFDSNPPPPLLGSHLPSSAPRFLFPILVEGEGCAKYFTSLFLLVFLFSERKRGKPYLHLLFSSRLSVWCWRELCDRSKVEWTLVHLPLPALFAWSDLRLYTFSMAKGALNLSMNKKW